MTLALALKILSWIAPVLLGFLISKALVAYDHLATFAKKEGIDLPDDPATRTKISAALAIVLKALVVAVQDGKLDEADAAALVAAVKQAAGIN